MSALEPRNALLRVGGPAVALAYLAYLAYLPALDGAFVWDDVDIYIVNVLRHQSQAAHLPCSPVV